MIPRNDVIIGWQKFTLDKTTFSFAYSAFLDTRIFPLEIKINVIAPLRLMKIRRNLKCLAKLSDGQIIPATIRIELLREHFSLPWASHYFYCNVVGLKV